jgi:hypothetical protein
MQTAELSQTGLLPTAPMEKIRYARAALLKGM